MNKKKTKQLSNTQRAQRMLTLQKHMQAVAVNAPVVTCPQCECPYFVQALKLTYISPLLAPTGQETLYPVANITMCTHCNAILNMDKVREKIKEMGNAKKDELVGNPNTGEPDIPDDVG